MSFKSTYYRYDNSSQLMSSDILNFDKKIQKDNIGEDGNVTSFSDDYPIRPIRLGGQNESFGQCVALNDGIGAIAAPDYSVSHTDGGTVYLINIERNYRHPTLKPTDGHSGPIPQELAIFDSTDNSNYTRVFPSDAGANKKFGSTGVFIWKNKLVVGSKDLYTDGSTHSGCFYIFDISHNGTSFTISNEVKVTAPSTLTHSNDRFTPCAVNSGLIFCTSKDSSSNLYMHSYDFNGNEIMRETLSTRTTQSAEIADVAQNRILVIDSNNDGIGVRSGRCFLYDLDGNFIKNIESPDPNFQEFGLVGAIGSGRIAISTYGRRSFYLFDLDGNKLFDSGVNNNGGQGPSVTTYEYFASHTLKIDNGRVYVSVTFRNNSELGQTVGSIFIYDIDGKFIQEITPTINPSNSSNSAVQPDTGNTFYGWPVTQSGVAIDDDTMLVGTQGDTHNGVYPNEDPDYFSAGAVWLVSRRSSTIDDIYKQLEK